MHTSPSCVSPRQFLEDFLFAGPTADPYRYVDDFRQGNPRTGAPDELRLCERWTAGPTSVFQFDVPGSVAKSTRAGLPWLALLRQMPAGASPPHCWPFDGLVVPEARSVVAEVYPSLFRRRYFEPPLTLPERRLAQLEGWISPRRRILTTPTPARCSRSATSGSSSSVFPEATPLARRRQVRPHLDENGTEGLRRLSLQPRIGAR